ncbi:isochorismate synthase [Liquorilactobacillus uvarum]|uniref:isochorismate synthase n=1 Tax=Liquorilactobacillus uvarum DSM 19971 TaxID=1423812 RepID=A0A0R1Q3Z1_9LACO|nr:isochorismate synthase [Liquorilactobacillus uvarum]KRL37556.1 menaquinone-specific isochorismate synthase [Liquorilactobacillus uvarum DSM 19971]
MNQLIYYLKTELPNIKLKKMLSLMTKWQTAFIFQAPSNNTVRLAYGAIAEHYFAKDEDQFNALKNWQVLLKKNLVNIKQTSENRLALVGSFAFDPNAEKENAFWGKLAQGYFFLPKYTVIKSGNSTELITCSFDAAALEKESSFFAQKLQNTPNYSLTLAEHVPFTKNNTALDQWTDAVAATTDKIQQHQLEKVVLARSLEATFSDAVNPLAVWRKLTLTQPQTYHILLKTASGSFISSTPERFAKFKNQQIQTAAVAGTIKRGQTRAEDDRLGSQLLNDHKNLQEQKYVLEAIGKILRKQGLTVRHSKRPQLLKNTNVQHLYTPIMANGNFELFQVLRDLHPTPALGGLPREKALRQIAQVEPGTRGLFGSPLGYFQFDDTGELAVGIRSALLTANSVHLFAGAGIVSESVPQNEAAETQLKFQPLLHVLGDQTDEHTDIN